MIRPAAFFIGLRYTRAKRRNHFISFISLVSMLGIALGVMVLITVMSVMNGFDREIQKRVFSMVAPLSLSSETGYVADWQNVQKIVMESPSIRASAPYVTGEVLLSFGGAVSPSLISGILPSEEIKITQLADKMVGGQLTNLQAKSFGIVVGENLANSLGANIGDKVTVVTPQVLLSPAGVMPRYKQFKIVGIFHAGNGFGFDKAMAFIHLQDGQRLFGLGENITGLHLQIDNPFLAPEIAAALANRLTGGARITTWGDQFGEFFHAVKLEKTMMFFILLLIIAVAAFNLVSTLVMIVSDKQSDIAILRTFGATPRMIMSIFMIQGAIVGIIGTGLGVIGGVLLAMNVTAIVNGLQNLFHVQLLSSSVYFINYLPSDIQLSDILKISFFSLFLSLIATIYPAFHAAKIDPVEALRYE